MIQQLLYNTRTYDQQQSTRRQQHLTDIYANKIMVNGQKSPGSFTNPHVQFNRLAHARGSAAQSSRHSEACHRKFPIELTMGQWWVITCDRPMTH